MDAQDVHGPTHWEMVGTTAAILLAANGHNPKIGYLFGMFHDCCRENDGHDPYHGHRAAGLLKSMRDQIPLDQDDFDALEYAIQIHHTEETPGYGSIEGCCLDGDRLDLGRVGMQIDPAYLSTEQARGLITGSLQKVENPEGILAVLWHGSKNLDQSETTRLESRGRTPIYLTEHKTICDWYGEAHRILLATKSMLDLTDPGRLCREPEFKHLVRIDKEIKKSGRTFKQCGEPFCLMTALEAGMLYLEDPTRDLTESLVNDLIHSTGHPTMRIHEDSASHHHDGVAVASWLTFDQTNTILWSDENSRYWQ